MLVFLSVIENKVVLCSYFLLFSPTTRSVTHNSKEPSSREKSHNARSLQENNARSAAYQSARTIVAI